MELLRYHAGLGVWHHLLGRLRFRQLALLVALGEHGNLHRAAEAVCMAQPSATKVVRELERIFGFPLFERVPRGMVPTVLGAEVVEFARRILGESQRFAEGLEVKRRGGDGHLVIGTILGAAAEQVGRAVAELKRRRPLLAVKVVGESSEQLIALLWAQTIDIAVAASVDSTLHDGLDQESLGSEGLCLIVRAHHPATRVSRLQLPALQEYPWVLPPFSYAVRQIMEQSFGEAAMRRPGNVIESTSWSATLEIVQHCDAVAVLPESVVRDIRERGLIVRLPIALAEPLSSSFAILTRRGEPMTTACAEFVEALKRCAAPAGVVQPCSRAAVRVQGC